MRQEVHRSWLAMLTVFVAAAALGASAQAPPAPPVLGWPAVFPAAVSETSRPPWSQMKARGDGLEIEMPHPSDWVLRGDPAPDLIVLSAQDRSRAVTVTTPVKAPFTIDQSMTPDRLAGLIPTLMRTNTADRFMPLTSDRFTLLSSGQVRTQAGSLWVWFEFETAPANVATGLTQLERMSFDKARAWTFATTSSPFFFFTVNCHVLTPRAASETDARDRVQRAAADCARMVTQVKTTRVPAP